MGLKLEKICKINEAKIGYRYSFSPNPDFGFIITNRDFMGTHVYYPDDGSHGLFRLNTEMLIFEFPMSSLEKELL
jgi:hypothetical protein